MLVALSAVRTGFLVEGHLVTDSRLVAQRYLRSSFLLDLVGSFPLNLILSVVSSAGDEDDGGADFARLNRQLRLLRIVKLNRLLRLSKLNKYLKYLEVPRPCQHPPTLHRPSSVHPQPTSPAACRAGDDPLQPGGPAHLQNLSAHDALLPLDGMRLVARVRARDTG